ncbi:hypothetical protein phiCbK_002 [Caulobacter phage phiCbK]|uniref:Uncharacterized protein n=5 Tax=Viruses TaxID=10239 RepID=J3SMJ2_9CAUD|nr:hypothetical protein D865_gp001 [Caulobacter phage phiCbK]YP_006988215.1 hypothetical protein D865_gp099 [Caulobacter phage phiCbK]ARB14921.1 hypothetical protein Ccr32_gp002 [Caulobacter phage Ccr32]ARB15252.1 hypothetical protein Ccr34_gp002 [Caulobacter phage Ccr34]AFO71515.1 hypothetical protein phiCbK_002 [Caulobacter phage phiCbK]AFU86833.1 hypothetical protein CbK_gp001 [Caulobacter phage phiCbK]AFU87151.1 hypothetical protein CbK_gp319 [Caulobacter phage phiCbK]
MAEFLALIPNLAPFLAWGILLWIAAEVVWSVCLWVYGLRTLFKLHRDDLAEAISFERALSPFD